MRRFPAGIGAPGGRGYQLGHDGRIALGVGRGRDDCYALGRCRILPRCTVEIARRSNGSPLLPNARLATKEGTQVLGAALGVRPAAMSSMKWTPNPEMKRNLLRVRWIADRTAEALEMLNRVAENADSPDFRAQQTRQG